MSDASSSSGNGLQVIPRIVSDLRSYFNLHGTKQGTWRKAQLRACLRLMEENEPAIRAALLSDVGKPWFEATFTEIVKVQTSIRSMLEQLDEWVAPVPCPTPVVLLPGTSYIIREPLGVILIIAPFNYPFQLTMLPLIAAIAAGNCALIKPSEEAPACSKLIAELIPRYLDTQAFRVVPGSIPETTALLAQKFDKIFFTGSTNVGRIVAEAAAKTLTPCTLELGGKSPVILGADADIPLAARRTMWGQRKHAAHCDDGSDRRELCDPRTHHRCRDSLTCSHDFSPSPRSSVGLCFAQANVSMPASHASLLIICSFPLI